MMRKGFGELVSPIMGTISIILAHSFSCLQSLVYAQAIARKLTAIEISDLRRVFAKGLNNSVISIIEKHSGIFGLNTRIFVPGNSIYIKNKGISMDVLLHEAIHIWQYQHRGNSYASDTLVAQAFIVDAYN
ncbi:MAG: hypothetical protein ISR55_06680 [Bacteroidetes bacterium]|nr:hypothetical protein [Bacteroidota bacterium]